MYIFAATPELSVAAALVDGAVTGTGFLMVTDTRTGEVIVELQPQVRGGRRERCAR